MRESELITSSIKNAYNNFSNIAYNVSNEWTDLNKVNIFEKHINDIESEVGVIHKALFDLMIQIENAKIEIDNIEL